MKRKIVVSTPTVTITALIKTDRSLMRHEVELLRDEMADRLMQVASQAKYSFCPLNKVRVR